MGGGRGRVQRAVGVPLRETIREDRSYASQPTAAVNRRSQHRRLHDRQE